MLDELFDVDLFSPEIGTVLVLVVLGILLLWLFSGDGEIAGLIRSLVETLMQQVG